MRLTVKFCFSVSLAITLLAVFSQKSIAAEDDAVANAAKLKLVLSFKPVQKGFKIEIPTAKQLPKCVVKVERKGKTSGWVVIGAEGQVLRRFLDTNGDNVVDQWCYYHNGLEVYRDLDTNFNNKVDQSRWLNSGGSRWGIDKNEDARIDEWKTISAEEASAEAVQALATKDVARLESLLLSAEDIKQLGIDNQLALSLKKSTSNIEAKMKKVLAKTTIISLQTKWIRFDSGSPSTIPADEGKAKKDLHVYENAMAITETKGKAGLIQIGELVRVGDTWKLTQVPQPLEGESIQIIAGGILMQPPLASVGNNGAGTIAELSPEVQKLLGELQKLDQNSPRPKDGRLALTRYNKQRAKLLGQLVSHAKTAEEREQWLQQMIDGIAAAVQTGTYSSGLKQLESIEKELKEKTPRSPLVAYVVYRRMLSQYSGELNSKTSSEDRQKTQDRWLKELERFTVDFPNAPDTADALMQLAIAGEYTWKIKAARAWYERLEKNFSKFPAGIRAKGALTRLDLEGRKLSLSGKGLDGGTLSISQFRGKVTLVIFWSTWCKPCTEDLPQMRALYQKYRTSGFEILGVNFDIEKKIVRPFLTQHKMTWSQIYDEGDMEAPAARDFGIVTLPTMILVDKTGKVISRATSVDALKKQLPLLLKK